MILLNFNRKENLMTKAMKNPTGSRHLKSSVKQIVNTKATYGARIDEDYKEKGVVTTFQGVRKFRDLETGEIVEMEMFNKQVKHGLPRGWRRVYMGDFMGLLGELYASARKIDVIEFIIDNLNSENQLTLTQTQVIEKTGIARQTVIDTYKFLIAKDFMRKDGACFRINTKFVCAFGSDRKNAIIATKYSDLEEPNLPNV